MASLQSSNDLSATTPPLGRKMHVLVVDDYTPNILIATELLDQCGCSYEVAYNGEEAFEMIQARDFDAVLMDVKMPVMNGLEATTRIREFERTANRRHVPIIGLTAHTFTADSEHCRSVGMDGYLSRPLEHDQLQNTLQQVKQLVI